MLGMIRRALSDILECDISITPEHKKIIIAVAERLIGEEQIHLARYLA
jgi:hypothetical protein